MTNMKVIKILREEIIVNLKARQVEIGSENLTTLFQNRQKCNVKKKTQDVGTKRRYTHVYKSMKFSPASVGYYVIIILRDSFESCF